MSPVNYNCYLPCCVLLYSTGRSKIIPNQTPIFNIFIIIKKKVDLIDGKDIMIKKICFIITALLLVFNIEVAAQVRIIAHRGCSSLAPENTFSAWKKAIEMKADYIELDIQLSKDDSLIIMHDSNLKRTTNDSGSINSFEYSKLRSVDAGSWFGKDFSGEKIPTFAEALKLAKENPDVKIIAEIKSSDSTIVEKVIKMIQDWKMQSRVIVSGFNFAQISQSKILDPTIDVQVFGTITPEIIDKMAAINGEWVGSGGAVTKELVDYAHSKNIMFNAWTINAAEKMIELIKLGVDGITTNFPQTLAEVIKKK